MDTKPTTDNKFFIYGSLRSGMDNFVRFWLTSENIVKSNVMLKNAKLFTLHFYPAVTLTGQDSDIVYGEIHKYSDETTVNAIDQMELSAGYSRKKVMVEDEEGGQHECVVYVFENEPYSDRVESGDWVEFKRLRGF